MTYDGLIVDLDGVVWLAGTPIEGAADAVRSLRERGSRVLFLTNDPSKSRDEHAARLTAGAIPAEAEDVVTAASATAGFLGGRDDLRGRTAFVIGSAAFKDEVAAAGYSLVSAVEAQQAEIVVVGGHDNFDFTELRVATRAVTNGALLFAAGRDRIVPTPEGPEPATGAILAALEFATGATATVIGKPEPLMFELAREALAGCGRVAVVGDNLASDIAGAKRAGLDAFLVLTGASTRADVDQADYPPDAIFSGLAELAAVVESSCWISSHSTAV